MLNPNTDTDHSILDELSTPPMKEEFDEILTHQVRMGAIRALNMSKAAGLDEVPSELLVHGGRKCTSSFTEYYLKLGEHN